MSEQKKAQATEAAKKLEAILPEINSAVRDNPSKPNLEKLERAKQTTEDVSSICLILIT